MNQSRNSAQARRFSLFDPPVLTLIVYVGVVILYFAGQLDSPLGRLLLIPALIGVVVVPIFTLRSLGQLVTSLLAGGQLMRFTSGVLRIERVEEDQLSVGLNHRWRHYAGGVITAPDEAANLRKWAGGREVGPFFGLLFYALLITAISPVIQSLPGIADDAGRINLVSTSIFALMVLTITLAVWQLVNRQIPRIWRMWRGNESADRQAAIIAMTSYLLSGRRPGEWPSEWSETATWDEDESVEGLYGYRFAYLHALDSGDLGRADDYFRYLEEHSDRLPSRLQEPLVVLEAPFVEAWIRGDPERARERLDAIENTVLERHRYRRVQAAVSFAESEWQEARKLANEGLDAAALKIHDGEVRAEAAILEEILQRTAEYVEDEETAYANAQP